MRRRYSISFFVVLASLILSFGWMYYESYQISQEKYELEQIKKNKESQEVDGRNVDSTVAKSGYYLKEEQGYIVVYLFDLKTVYEETSIQLKNLDKELQQQIKNTKYIPTTEELYGFLENYSS